MLFAHIPGALLLITSSVIAGPISPSSFDASTEAIEAGAPFEASAKPAFRIIADTLGADAIEAVKASAEVVSSIAVDFVST
jgi:hypothetical protein